MIDDRPICECPKCGRQHRFLANNPPPAISEQGPLAKTPESAVYVTIPRAQYEALMVALKAADLLEKAEDFNANDCRECEGEGEPEACPVCFPLFDDARVTRRNALEKARAADILEGE